MPNGIKAFYSLTKSIHDSSTIMADLQLTAPTPGGRNMSCRQWTMSSRELPLLDWAPVALRPHLARIGTLARDCKGMSAVEFGLAAPVFLAMLTPVIDLGLAFSQQIRVNQAVEAGAQYASSNPYAGTSWASAVSSAITNATSLSVNPSVGAETCGCPNSTSTAIVTGSYGTPPTCTSNSCPDGTSPGYYVTITGNVTYTSVMPYSILGSSARLSSQAVVRVE